MPLRHRCLACMGALAAPAGKQVCANAAAHDEQASPTRHCVALLVMRFTAQQRRDPCFTDPNFDRHIETCGFAVTSLAAEGVHQKPANPRTSPQPQAAMQHQLLGAALPAALAAQAAASAARRGRLMPSRAAAAQAPHPRTSLTPWATPLQPIGAAAAQQQHLQRGEPQVRAQACRGRQPTPPHGQCMRARMNACLPPRVP